MSRLTVAFVLLGFFHAGLAGSLCPAFEEIYPCFCTSTQEQTSYTIMVCAGIRNSSELEKATLAMKSLILDRFMLLNVFHDHEEPTEAEVAKEGERLPSNWLAALRVKELEIQHGSMSSCFLCDDALAGQNDFLTSLVATHCSLSGHLCSTCNSRTKSVSTRELQKTSRLKHVDFSWNNIEVIDGFAFPHTSRELKKLVLSNNKINRVHDKAFSNLQLVELDLSKNKLTSFTRKVFREDSDRSLRILDLSWNSLQTLPDDIFLNLSALKEVRLSYNLLEVLPADTWTRIPATVEKVDVKGNFLVCNCSLSWIARLSRTTKISGKCVAPKDVEFQELKSTLTSIQSC